MLKVLIGFIVILNIVWAVSLHQKMVEEDDQTAIQIMDEESPEIVQDASSSDEAAVETKEEGTETATEEAVPAESSE